MLHRGHEYLQIETTTNLRRHAVSHHVIVLPTIKLRQHGVYHPSSYCQQPNHYHALCKIKCSQTTRCITSRACTANHQQTRRLNQSICREVLPLCSHRGHEYLQIEITTNLRRHAVSPHVLVLPTIKFIQHGVYHSSSYLLQPSSGVTLHTNTDSYF